MLWIAHNKSSKFIYGKCIAFFLLTDDVFHMETFSLPGFINCELKHRCLSSWNWFSFSHFYISPFNFAWHTFFFISFPIFHSQFQLAASRCPIRALNGKQVRREWKLCSLHLFFWISCQRLLKGKMSFFPQTDGSLDWSVQSIGAKFFTRIFFSIL